MPLIYHRMLGKSKMLLPARTDQVLLMNKCIQNNPPGVAVALNKG